MGQSTGIGVIDKAVAILEATADSPLTLAELVQMNILGAEDREKVAREIRKNPNILLQLIVKMASAMVTPESEGIEVTPESAVDGDVDGWFKRSPNGQRIPVR